MIQIAEHLADKITPHFAIQLGERSFLEVDHEKRICSLPGLPDRKVVNQIEPSLMLNTWIALLGIYNSDEGVMFDQILQIYRDKRSSALRQHLHMGQQ